MGLKFRRRDRREVGVAAAAGVCVWLLGLPSGAWAQSPTSGPTTLRVMTHSSFDLPKPLLAQFEKDAGVKLQIIKGGAAGEMLNKLILTRAQPVADVVFGIDNALVAKAAAVGQAKAGA